MQNLNRVKTAARKRGLFLLREMARRNPLDIQDLLALSAENVLATLDRTDIRLMAAVAFRTQRFDTKISDNNLIDFCVSFRAAANGSSVNKERYRATEQCPNLLCFGQSELMKKLVGPMGSLKVEEDPVLVAGAVDRGLSFIRAIWPTEAELIVENVDICLGLKAPSGEVRCLSDIDVPGFVAIAHDNPAVLLAEQLVHEATHVRLAIAIEEDGWYSDLVAALPPCYSPFKQSVRPAERTLHGVVSYGRVLLLWQVISRCAIDLTQAFGGVDSTKIGEIISRRIVDLKARISMGWASLIRGVNPDELELIEKLAESILGIPIYEICEELEKKSITNEFSPILRAEFLLGSAGYKASRIGLKLGDHQGFEALVRTGAAFTVSREAYISRSDPAICGFSNTFEGTEGILFANENSEVLCYVSNDPAVARATAELDKIDNAGDKFGIPRCCQVHFHTNWKKTREHGGDLFAPLVHSLAANGTAPIRWQCNAAAMYFGGGLCWHFPCSPACQETIALVNKRAEQLSLIDMNLTFNLIEIQRQEFFLTNDGNYKTILSQSERSAIHVTPF